MSQKKAGLMKTKQYAYILVVLLVVSAVLWFGYKKLSVNPAIQDQAYSLCYVYLYDKANPSVHASYGPDYHIKKWQEFEKRNGYSGAKSIDEFCKDY